MAAKPDKKSADAKDAKAEEAPALTPEEQLAKLQKKVRISQFLLIATFVISSGLGGAALAWAAITSSSVKNLEPEKADALNDKIDAMEKRLSVLFGKQDEFEFKVESTYSAIEEIRAMREQRDFSTIQKILIDQRTDYNDMLAILNTGVVALANMMRGSRDWTNTYTKRIEHAIEVNRQRIETINQLPTENGQNAATPKPSTSKETANGPAGSKPSADSKEAKKP